LNDVFQFFTLCIYFNKDPVIHSPSHSLSFLLFFSEQLPLKIPAHPWEVIITDLKKKK